MPSLRPLECTYAAVPEMPSGNLVKSGCRFPDESRDFWSQQSSMLTYWYPAAAIPEETILSAVDLMSDSETLHPKAFQSLKPICGVSARPLFRAAAGGAAATVPISGAAANAATAARARRFLWITNPLQ